MVLLAADERIMTSAVSLIESDVLAVKAASSDSVADWGGRRSSKGVACGRGWGFEESPVVSKIGDRNG